MLHLTAAKSGCVPLGSEPTPLKKLVNWKTDILNMHLMMAKRIFR